MTPWVVCSFTQYYETHEMKQDNIQHAWGISEKDESFKAAFMKGRVCVED